MLKIYKTVKISRAAQMLKINENKLKILADEQGQSYFIRKDGDLLILDKETL